MEKNEILDSNVFSKDDKMVRPKHMASGGKRFANYLIDVIFIYIIAIAIGVVLALDGRADAVTDPGVSGRLFSYLIGAVVIVVYYTIFESLTGKSIGKYITKTKVVNRDFSLPDTATILKRSLCRLIPFEAFSFLGSSVRGWHDSITETWVIDENSIE